jgi:hypothetical protein
MCGFSPGRRKEKESGSRQTGHSRSSSSSSRFAWWAPPWPMFPYGCAPLIVNTVSGRGGGALCWEEGAYCCGADEDEYAERRLPIDGWRVGRLYEGAPCWYPRLDTGGLGAVRGSVYAPGGSGGDVKEWILLSS